MKHCIVLRGMRVTAMRPWNKFPSIIICNTNFV